jgi:microcystin-dependent protein
MALDKFKVKKGIEVADTFAVAGVSLIPTGTIALWPTATCPGGWVECNGQELLIGTTDSQYNELYKSITNNGSVFPFGANTNGSGSVGSTHFRLPELEGRIAIGSGTGTGLTARSLGQWGGTNTVPAPTIDNITSHTHTMTHTHTMSHTHASPGHDGVPHVSGDHTHSVGDHTHPAPPAGSVPHSHNAFFGNTGAPGTSFRMQSAVSSPAVNMTGSGSHAHGVPSGSILGDVFSDVDTSGDSLNQATGSGTGNTAGPSQASTSSRSGSSTSISTVQKSYSLMYIVKV